MSQPGVGAHTREAEVERLQFEANLDKIRPYLKAKIKTKGLRGMAQVVDHLPRMCPAMGTTFRMKKQVFLVPISRIYNGHSRALIQI
jgi:hypothetical protein